LFTWFVFGGAVGDEQKIAVALLSPEPKSRLLLLINIFIVLGGMCCIDVRRAVGELRLRLKLFHAIFVLDI
jgi:hypothetical protein